MTHPTLLCLGSVNLDLQVRAGRWPRPGETMTARDLLRGAGGKAANRAIAARRLGAPAALFGRIGGDDFAAEVRATLAAAGVDLRGLQAVRDEATGLALVVVQDDGEKTILLVRGANDAWQTGEIAGLEQAIAAAAPRSVLTLDLEAPLAVVTAAARAARARRLVVILDPSPADRMPDELYPLVDYLTPNPAEAETLTGVAIRGTDEGLEAAQALLRRGVGTACVKLGEGGCVTCGAEATETVPALPVDVVDKTGAGDAFAAALGVALLTGQSPRRAVHAGVAAASLAVTVYGAQPSYPDRGRLAEALAELERRM